MTPAPGRTTENTATRCPAASQAVAVSAAAIAGPRPRTTVPRIANSGKFVQQTRPCA
jgi:hypothetical protein